MFKVLVYHRIIRIGQDGMIPSAFSVGVDDFRRQLELLDEWGFTTVTFDDYALCLRGELSLPKRPVIISFDDGYLDTYELAYPLMQEHGMRGVIFVLGDRKVHRNHWDFQTESEAPELMRDEHILELHAAGFEIGAHSLTHARLPELSRDRAYEEIARARMNLEHLLNAPVRTFAYPFGLTSPWIKQMVKDAGYTYACSVYTGPGTFAADPYEIRRLDMASSAGVAGFALRMLTPYEQYQYARSVLREWLRGKSRRSAANRSGDIMGKPTEQNG